MYVYALSIHTCVMYTYVDQAAAQPRSGLSVPEDRQDFSLRADSAEISRGKPSAVTG